VSHDPSGHHFSSVCQARPLAGRCEINSFEADLVPLIGPANAAVARFDGILQGMVNPSILLSPLATQEAVLSSRIEGTQATLQEVLEFDAAPSIKGENYLDIQEIVNYRKAMQTAVESLKSRPLCLNLLKDIRACLLDSVRGQNKRRGEFRRQQNYIARPGAGIEDASFVPPAPEAVGEALDQLEKYFHFEEKDRLVQLAVVHAQFELIHPFLGGNGRVGRMPVPLFLFEKGLLSSPVFYVSSYLEARRDEYYAALRSISSRGDWDGWIRFFLNAATAQAVTNAEKARSILALYTRLKDEVTRLTRSPHSILALDALFTAPVITPAEFCRVSGIPRRSAFRILDVLRQEGILVEMRAPQGRQPAVLGFRGPLDVVE